MYASSDISATFQNFNAGYQELSRAGLPLELALQQFVVNIPQGKMFGVNFHWGSDNEEAGRVNLEKVEKLGTVVMNTITYELLSHAIERSNNIVSLFKELENIRIDA
jgi:hypothetical protein